MRSLRSKALTALNRRDRREMPQRSQRTKGIVRTGCKSVAQKQMRSGPATPTALCVDLISRHPAARSCGSTVPVRQRPLRSATFTGTVCTRAVRRIARLQFLRRPAAQPAHRASLGGGRNARATGSRSRAFPISPGNSPSRIAGCHRRHRKHRSARFESCHVFAEPNSAASCCGGQ